MMFLKPPAGIGLIIPVRLDAAAAPAAGTAGRGLLRRTFGRYTPSRRTFGRYTPSRRTFGRYTPSRRTFGLSHP
jgi:hypothetical protein